MDFSHLQRFPLRILLCFLTYLEGYCAAMIPRQGEILMHDSQPPSGFQLGGVTDKQLVNLAKLAGINIQGEVLAPELLEFALLIMEKCAGVGDKYIGPKGKRTAGDEIRGLFGL